ncbi:Non-specific lipid transfer protein GPI-anchored 21 [Linum grandiflorum]
MASFTPNMAQLLLLLSMAMVLLVSGQIPTPTTPACSASAIAGLSPCMSFLTNNGTTPPADCCNSLKNLTSTSTDCLCLAITGALPFQIPINRTLALSLPRACNMPGVPLQCKAATGAPAPAPGQAAALAPSPAPGVSQSDTPAGSAVPETPSDGSTPTTPALNPPSTATGISPTTNTSAAAAASYSFSPFVMLFLLGFMFCNFN